MNACQLLDRGTVINKNDSQHLIIDNIVDYLLGIVHGAGPSNPWARSAAAAQTDGQLFPYIVKGTSKENESDMDDSYIIYPLPYVHTIASSTLPVLPLITTWFKC